MAETASRVYGPAQPGTGNATLYTVPGGTTAVIRNIHICNTTGTAATVSLAVNGSAATAANLFIAAQNIPANGSYDWSGFLALATAETIQGLQGTLNACTVTISGVLIT